MKRSYIILLKFPRWLHFLSVWQQQAISLPFYMYIMNWVFKMKFVTLLLLILIIQVNSEHIKFGEQAINAIFKDKKDALLLFTSPSDS